MNEHLRFSQQRSGLVVPRRIDEELRALRTRATALETDVAALETSVADLPLGYLDYGADTDGQGSITTVVDLTNLDVTWTAVTGRLYKVTAHCDATSDTAGDVIVVQIATSGNSQVARATHRINAANVSETFNITFLYAPSAGSQTLKMRMSRASGSGTCSMQAGSSFPAWIIVEDVGSL